MTKKQFQNNQNDDVYESCQESLVSMEQSIKTSSKTKKSIQKSKSLRNYPEQKQLWTQIHKKRYCMFYLKLKTDHPYYNISWATWKTDQVYPKMSEFINADSTIQSKNKEQCKSADQRMKTIHFINFQRKKQQQKDILQVCYEQIQKYSNDKECCQIIQNFNKKLIQQSQHMRLCQQALRRLEQKSFDFEILYKDIMSPQQNKHQQFYSNTDVSNDSIFIDDN